MANEPAVVLKRFNKDRTAIETVAYLENAYNVSYALPANDIYRCSFKIPADDYKASNITPTSLLEIWDNGERVELFMVDELQEESNKDGHFLVVTGSHVRKFLQRIVLHSVHERSGNSIEDVIRWLLRCGDGESRQTDWVLSPKFNDSISINALKIDYHFENSNIDAALWSVPQNWKTSTRWEYDTTVYPWHINLVEVSDAVSSIIQRGKNLNGLSIAKPVETVANRFYGLGSGEGINQTSLMFAEDLEVDPTGNAKNGAFYVEDKDSIDKYGLVEDYYTDRSVSNPSLLLMGTKKALNDYKEVRPVIAVEAVDLYPQTKQEQDHFVTGTCCRIIDPETGVDEVHRILNVSKSDVTGQPYAVNITLGDMPNTLASTIDRLYNRDNTDKVNAQGATNIWSRPFADNVDVDHPIKITFRLPDDLVYVNKLVLDVQVEKFRAYETGQKSGGGNTGTSKEELVTDISTKVSSDSAGDALISGGVNSATSEAFSAKYSYPEGDDHPTQTTTHWSFHNEKKEDRTIEPTDSHDDEPDVMYSVGFVYPADIALALNTVVANDGLIPVIAYQHEHPHVHKITIPSHTHQIEAHSHNIEHTHKIGGHSHKIDDHTHAIEYGIYEEPTLSVSSIRVQFNNNDIDVGAGLEFNDIDILNKIQQKQGQKISRGKHTLTITPITNDGGKGLCRITGELFIQCFIQSRGDYAV